LWKNWEDLNIDYYINNIGYITFQIECDSNTYIKIIGLIGLMINVKCDIYIYIYINNDILNSLLDEESC